MVCAGAKYCSIMSYHPESTSANYFLAIRHNFLSDDTEIVADGHTEKM